ncbi:MAG: penicillin-binding protein activator LpoB [Planctomycetota bacterium]
MTRYLPPLCLSLAAAMFLAACTNNPARRIDPQGTETITSYDNLDVQDATDAAGAMSASLLSSGLLGADGQPSVIAIDRYVNNTTQQIDRDEVVKKIRVSLNQAGVAQTLTTIDSRGETGGESNIASKFARENVDAERDLITPEPLVPDYALTYKILENRARAGKVRQTTFTFQMSLVDVRNGLAVWEDEKQITKQGDKSSVGW